ncbi:hypothetical protein BVRB_3g063690 [Beta vulgaris subsp. vulgaris]|nr:hypothetical protein BVRB_3g063690 [Beta vulgaris subsp. vulgaris]
MEAHKERKEEDMKVEKRGEGSNNKTENGVIEENKKVDEPGIVDPTVKVLLHNAIISDDNEKNIAQNPHNVLAFSRSVDKVDSSLE